MNYLKHLQKINNTRGGGGRFGYSGLVGCYLLNYMFNRPVFVKLTRRARYQNKRKLFYTVMTGSYDRLNEIVEPLDGWDYVCFTDNPELRSSSWRVVLLENRLDLDPVRLSRHYKINNHLIDAGYDFSVYVDANIKIRGDLDTFMSHALPQGKHFGVLLHPFHSSLAKELELCIAAGKDDEALLREQNRFYTVENGFTDPFPHINARMLIRKAEDPGIKVLMETWFGQLLVWSRRDQIAFNFALSTCSGVTPHYIPYWIFRCYFKKMDHR